MIGIRFTSHGNHTSMLGLLFGHPGLEGYSWNISEYIPLYGEGLQEGIYTREEALKLISAKGDDVPAEYYCVFGAGVMPDMCDAAPQTFQDYLDGGYELAFVCTDSGRFDLYCKDEGVLRGLRSAFVSSGICADCEIGEYIMENNGRAGFHW